MKPRWLAGRFCTRLTHSHTCTVLLIFSFGVHILQIYQFLVRSIYITAVTTHKFRFWSLQINQVFDFLIPED